MPVDTLQHREALRCHVPPHDSAVHLSCMHRGSHSGYLAEASPASLGQPGRHVAEQPHVKSVSAAAGGPLDQPWKGG
jgi:hypothetical protein